MIWQLSGFGGWRGSVLLLVAYVVLELGSFLLGGDWGAFLYVTCHFVLMPFLAAGVILLTVTQVMTQRASAWTRIKTSISVVIPVSIIGLAVSGDPGLARLLPPF